MSLTLHSIYKFTPCALMIGAAGSVLVLVLSHFAEEYIPTINYQAFTAGQVLAENGRDNIPACLSCHGQNGEGNTATATPRLAGLNAEYIQKQLQDFARNTLKTRVDIDPIARDYTRTPRSYGDLTVFTPGTRKHGSMNQIARQLTEPDISNLSTYFSRLPFTANPMAFDFETLERGEDLALRGKPEYGLPACNSCHGDKGVGQGAVFPPLSGQPMDYIIDQINKWQTGLRDNDNLALMRHVANQMTDGDKQNVASYYANQSYSVNNK